MRKPSTQLTIIILCSKLSLVTKSTTAKPTENANTVIRLYEDTPVKPLHSKE